MYTLETQVRDKKGALKYEEDGAIANLGCWHSVDITFGAMSKVTGAYFIQNLHYLLLGAFLM